MPSTRTSTTAGEAATTDAPSGDTAAATTEVFQAPDESPKTPEPTEGSLRIKYTGSTMHTRQLSDADFKKAGLEGVGKQEWSLENNHTVDFSETKADKEALTKFLTEGDVFKTDGKPTFKVLSAGEI